MTLSCSGGDQWFVGLTLFGKLGVCPEAEFSLTFESSFSFFYSSYVIGIEITIAVYLGSWTIHLGT